MITYTDVVVVKLENQPVGMIWQNPGGCYYLPLGFTYEAGITKVYPTLSLCKAALEAE